MVFARAAGAAAVGNGPGNGAGTGDACKDLGAGKGGSTDESCKQSSADWRAWDAVGDPLTTLIPPTGALDSLDVVCAGGSDAVGAWRAVTLDTVGTGGTAAGPAIHGGGVGAAGVASVPVRFATVRSLAGRVATSDMTMSVDSLASSSIAPSWGRTTCSVTMT